MLDVRIVNGELFYMDKVYRAFWLLQEKSENSDGEIQSNPIRPREMRVHGGLALVMHELCSVWENSELVPHNLAGLDLRTGAMVQIAPVPDWDDGQQSHRAVPDSSRPVFKRHINLEPSSYHQSWVPSIDSEFMFQHSVSYYLASPGNQICAL